MPPMLDMVVAPLCAPTAARLPPCFWPAWCRAHACTPHAGCYSSHAQGREPWYAPCTHACPWAPHHSARAVRGVRGPPLPKALPPTQAV
ncbi:MAG: hypothetical protein J3K34DRAFT_446424 [Monoraphidium minutum]|nr:MAG: hypothetical protein J3K34DRAFT_446424 [Monoraphidium minutum]